MCSNCSVCVVQSLERNPSKRNPKSNPFLTYSWHWI